VFVYVVKVVSLFWRFLQFCMVPVKKWKINNIFFAAYVLIMHCTGTDTFVEESINDFFSVDLGICNTGAIGNNDLVVAVQVQKPC